MAGIMPPVFPVTPEQARKQKAGYFPDIVMEAFNELIVAGLDARGTSTVDQDDVINLIISKAATKGEKYDRQLIFDRNWLDVEPVFEDAGWDVSYDKPAYNETYTASWTFKGRTRAKR